MKLRIFAIGVAAVTGLSLATPASAATISLDYRFSVTDFGKTVTFGNMVLNYDGSTYSLESLVLSVSKKTKIVTSYVTLSPIPGTSDYCLYTLAACDVVPEKNSIYLIFDPSLTSQTSTFYDYSTKDLMTESFTFDLNRTTVPEPATWAMMLFGFGAIGASMRTKRLPAASLAA